MEIKAQVKNIIFVAEGGLGRAIASTAVVKKLKETYPDKNIIVVTGYPDVYLYNPRVKKVFNMNNPLYFYDDYINEESYIIKVEPYTEYGYIIEHKHLIRTWCEMLGLDPEGAVPEMYFLDNEIEAGQIYVDKLTGNGKKNFILMQWTGGIPPKSKEKHDVFDAVARMHKRSLPQNVAQKIANKLISRDFVVGCVQHENQPKIEGAELVFFPFRSVIVLLKLCQGFIGVDSFLQHAAAALGIKGVVCWGGTHPQALGYELHRNLTREACDRPFCHRPNSYIFDASPTNTIWNCPHNEKCMQYDADEIVKAYEEVYAKTAGKE